jgi:hypothetical protein
MDLLQRQQQPNEFNLQSIKQFNTKNNNKNKLITLSFPLNFNNTNVTVKSLKKNSLINNSSLTTHNNNNDSKQRTSLTNSMSTYTRRSGIKTAPPESSIYEPSVSSRLNQIRNDLLNSLNNVDCNELINTSINNKADIHQKIMSKLVFVLSYD